MKDGKVIEAVISSGGIEADYLLSHPVIQPMRPTMLIRGCSVPHKTFRAADGAPTGDYNRHNGQGACPA
jgi:hypothetical protein